MKSRLLPEVAIVNSRYFILTLLLFFITGCVHTEGKTYVQVLQRSGNFSMIKQMATDYYTEKGSYPLSLVQLEAYVLSKEKKRSAGTSHEANNVLGIINPYNQGVGYGEAYADAWY